DHEARRETPQLFRWRVRMPPSVSSAFPPDVLRKMTPPSLSRDPSMRHPAARVLRAGALLLAHTSQRTRWMRAKDADTDVTTVRGISPSARRTSGYVSTPTTP